MLSFQYEPALQLARGKAKHHVILKKSYIDLVKPRSGTRIFFPARLVHSTKLNMDNVRILMAFHSQLLRVRVEN